MRKIILPIFYLLLAYDVFRLIYRLLMEYSPANLGYDILSIISKLIVIWIIIKLNAPRKKLTKFEHWIN